MPRLQLAGLSLPHATAVPPSTKRWFITGWLIQGTGDGVVTVSGGDRSGAANETMLTVTTAASGGGAVAAEGSSDIGTALTAAEIVVSTSGTPGTLSGYIDYSWR